MRRQIELKTLSPYEMSLFARALAEAVTRSMDDKQNRKEYEDWKLKRDSDDT